MGKTTRRTQAAVQKRVADIQPNQPSGRPAPPKPPPNAFQGSPERVPQLVYVTDVPNDGFLGQAREYYAFFGIPVKLVKSVHDIVVDLGKRQGVFERIAIVSHAHPRGMLLPMFSGATPGTNRELFEALAASDYDGLLVMSPFDASSHHTFPWRTRVDKLMKVARTKNAAVLKPLGLDRDGTPPAGDLAEFFFHCFDAVFVKEPGNVTVKGAALAAADRATLLKFIDEILNQLTARLVDKPISGRTVSAAEWKALRAALVAIPFADLTIAATMDLDLTFDNMNWFTSLAAMVKAVKGGLHAQLDAARTRLAATSRVDIRGCRVGAEPAYLEAIGAFFGRGDARPIVSGPQRFESFSALFFDTLNSRDNIRVWLSKPQRMHSPERLRELLGTWAEFIRVNPLHTTFWTALLEGPAARLVGLTETDVPALFVPAPGLKPFFEADAKKQVAALASFFNVAKAAVPAGAALNTLAAAMTRVRPAAPALTAPAPDTLAADRLQQLYEDLRDASRAENQTIVPDEPPAPLRASHIRDYQTRLLDHLDATPLAALKKVMTAAAASLKDGDGLYYYMFQAGLPVFIFGRPEAGKNSIVVYTPQAAAVRKSWYQCLWKDPLPETGKHLTANVSAKLAHTLPTLVEDDRVSIASICPLPRFRYCIRTRPKQPLEPDDECGSLSNP